MKFFGLSLLLLSLFLIRCESDIKTPESSKIIQIDTTIKNYETFYYRLGRLKNNEGTGISLKPKHAEINEMYSDSSTIEIIYKYKALEDYFGNDSIELYRDRNQESGVVNIVDTIKINLKIEEGL